MKRVRQRLVQIIALAALLSSLSPIMAVPVRADVLGGNNFASFINACTGNAANTPVCNDVNNQAKSGQNEIIVIIRDVIDALSYAVGLAAVFIIIISGIKFVSSGGDAKTAGEAKNGLLGAVIGILVVALAQVFVLFVLDRLNI